MGIPLAYFITFTTYGTRLPGDPRGHVNRRQNVFGTLLPEASSSRRRAAEHVSVSAPFVLDEQSRRAVSKAIHGVCQYRKWQLIALHVRSNHVHVAVSAQVPVGVVLHDFKAYASRELNRICNGSQQRWSRHGSTRYLWTQQSVDAAVRYIAEEQGWPMESFVARSVDW